MSRRDIEGFDVLMLHMAAGDLKAARDMAATANVFVELNHRAQLMLAVDGFDDDPRELDQIPEARATLAALHDALTPAALARMDETHRALMLVAVGLAVRRGTQIYMVGT